MGFSLIKKSIAIVLMAILFITLASPIALADDWVKAKLPQPVWIDTSHWETRWRWIDTSHWELWWGWFWISSGYWNWYWDWYWDYYWAWYWDWYWTAFQYVYSWQRIVLSWYWYRYILDGGSYRERYWWTDWYDNGYVNIKRNWYFWEARSCVGPWRAAAYVSYGYFIRYRIWYQHWYPVWFQHWYQHWYWVDTSHWEYLPYWKWVVSGYWEPYQVWVVSGYWSEPLHGTVTLTKSPSYIFTRWHYQTGTGKDEGGSDKSHVDYVITWTTNKPIRSIQEYVLVERYDRAQSQETVNIGTFSFSSPTSVGSLSSRAEFAHAGDATNYFVLQATDGTTATIYCDMPVNGFIGINVSPTDQTPPDEFRKSIQDTGSVTF